MTEGGGKDSFRPTSRERGLALTHYQDLDQLTQILKVTGVPGAEFVQKLKDKAVSGNGPRLA